MKKKWTIRVDKIPENITVEKFIIQNTDITAHIQKISTANANDYIFLKLKEDIARLKIETLDLLTKYPSFPFSYKGRESVYESYLSTAITGNPQSIDAVSTDPHQSGIGSSKYSSGNSNFYLINEAEKNSYADSYSFNKRTPFSKEGAINELLNTFKRTLIRSRVSVIKANSKESLDPTYLWHQDESIFLNLRVNIPVQSNENYVIQFIDKSNDKNPITEFQLVPGNAYVYNTEKFHRPYCKSLNQTERINIICGISPWFDYDEDSNSWISNEFYGELHPFDMFIKGHVSSIIGR